MNADALAADKVKAVEMLWDDLKHWASHFRQPKLTAPRTAVRAHAFSFLAKLLLTMR